jgi:YVTN family beta-propeller protein
MVVLQFRVLGGLEVLHEGRAVALGGHQQRAVLAMLVLHAGEVVSADRLIEGLWGDRPPARATKAVHVHVSRLRTALTVAGDGAREELIATRDRGYTLRVADAQIDGRVFQDLLGAGRRAYREQAFERAAGLLRQALELWRGAALADFSFDEFAQSEIARLEEMRLEALEIRIEADLALGRHAAIVAELEVLTAQHPTRECLQRQRMLALYRCGRQSDALAVYRHAREALVDAVGVEPSAAMRELHLAMLRQDPALDAPSAHAAAPPSTEPGAVRRRRLSAQSGVAAAACLGALVGLAGLLAHGGASPVVAEANSVAVIDPARNAVVRDVAVGARPGDISAGAGGVWVANLDDRSLSEIDPTSASVTRTLFPRTNVDAVAAGAGALWITDFQRATVTRLDPAFGDAVRTIRMGPRPLMPGAGSSGPSPIALAGRSVWAATSNATVVRIDAGSRQVEPQVAVGNDPAGIAVGAGSTWAADDVDNIVSRIDAAGTVTQTVPVGEGASGVAVGAGGVWVTNTGANTVTRIDPTTGGARATIPVGEGPRGIAVGLGAVWVADSRSASVSRIEPRSNRVVETIAIGESPEDVVVAAGRVWVSVQAGSPPPGDGVPGGTLRIVQSADFGSTDPAVMRTYGSAAWQLEYATCAKLLNYPDLPGPRGTRLVPEVAAAQPTVSPDGGTYTFAIRSGYRFSPPSGQPVTARAFQRALERFLSPKMQPAGSVVEPEMSDIVGVGAYRAGRTPHIAGITATQRTLTIRLIRPAPSLPARLAMPYFCAVPPGTPIRPGGVEHIPSAGPYYIDSRTRGSELVLRRNPNYHGPRPRRLDAIDYRFGATAARDTALVEAGRSDYVDDPLAQLRYASAVSPAVDARLERDYGPHSPAARSGHQRYFINSVPGVSYLMLNARRPLFAGSRMRRAASVAVDRAALARNAQPGMASRPTDQYLPPTIPGFRDANIYPLGGPDVARARQLARGQSGRAVMVTCTLAPCLKAAETVKANLSAIGITVDIKRFPFPEIYKREAPDQPWDIAWSGWGADYADPSQFINPSTPGFAIDFPGRDAVRYRQRIADAARLSGTQRLRAYGRLDVDLAGRAAPVIAFAVATARDFFSARIGCQIYQPIYGIDLSALCLRGPTAR